MAQVAKQRFAVVPVDQLRCHPANPRQGDVGLIASSIEENGFYGAVVAQEGTNFILVGNHRYEAAKHKGLKDLPVFFVDVDDDRALRILLVDNKANDEASYNDQALAELLAELTSTPLGLAGTGFDGDDLDDLLAKLSEDEPMFSEPESPSSLMVMVRCKSPEEQSQLVERLCTEGFDAKAVG